MKTKQFLTQVELNNWISAYKSLHFTNNTYVSFESNSACLLGALIVGTTYNNDVVGDVSLDTFDSLFSRPFSRMVLELANRIDGIYGYDIPHISKQLCYYNGVTNEDFLQVLNENICVIPDCMQSLLDEYRQVLNEINEDSTYYTDEQNIELYKEAYKHYYNIMHPIPAL